MLSSRRLRRDLDALELTEPDRDVASGDLVVDSDLPSLEIEPSQGAGDFRAGGSVGGAGGELEDGRRRCVAARGDE